MSVEGASQSESPDRRVGSYRLLQSLGAGGMSSVFRAIHVETGVEVAVKVLPRAFAKNPTTIQRFLREVKNAESLEHPGIVAILDHGIDQGRHYLVMEYVAGGDLHDRVRDNGPMSVSESLEVVRSVADSLRYANSQGLIHRDIKPANILLTHEHKVKLADLGLALHEQAEDERVTREGTTVGTVDYMAPEQARDSRGTSIRSDMYSLGCTFYFLLTGQPPYPSGDIADKLARHCTAPIPDPSDFRGDLSEPLLALVAKLLAKRPDQRFESYDALIDAIDRVPRAPASHSLGSTLIQSPSPLFALMDDEDEPSGRVDFRKSKAAAKQGNPTGQPIDSGLIPLDDLSLPEVGDLVEDASPALITEVPRREGPTALPRLVEAKREAFEPDSESESEEPAIGTALATRNPVSPQIAAPVESARTFIMSCVLIGLSIILIVIGADWLFRPGALSDNSSLVDAIESLSEEDDPDANGLNRAVVVAAAAAKPKQDSADAPVSETSAQPSVWSEPLDAETQLDPEPDYGAIDESRLIPVWARVPDRSAPTGKIVILQRLVDPRSPETKSTLKSAFEVVGATAIEIRDNGPFFERDLRFVGDRRWLGASAGFRPMIVIEPSRGETAAAQDACFDLGEKELVLEGVDLVIDLAKIARSTVAIFSVGGGSLTLRNCTLTLLNQSDQSFSIVKTGRSTKASRCLLDLSIVRGSFTSFIEAGSGPVQTTISRSLIFNRTGCVVLDTGQGSGPPDREFAIIRSILATGNSTFVRAGSVIAARSRKLLVLRALGSTFAHFQTLQPVPFCRSLGPVAPAEMMDWKGEANEFQGWSSWFAVSGSPEGELDSLQAARSVWESTDRLSVENRIPWPDPPIAERIVPAQLYEFAPSRLTTLQRLPTPAATLLEQTANTFDRPDDPQPYTREIVASAPDSKRLIPNSRDFAPTKAAGAPFLPPSERRVDTPAFGVVPGQIRGTPHRDLVFKTDEPGQNGDLGLFLAANIKPGEKLVRVRVEGFGDHPFTPFRAPDDLGLEILVVPRPGGIVPSWNATTTTSAGAMIELRGGSLSLTGMKLNREGSPLLRSIIRVERGHLIINRCRLTESAKASKSEGAMIEFVASGTKPLDPLMPEFSGPFDGFYDRPVCSVSDSILKGAGRVVSSELGRGMLAFRQSVLISSETILDLTLSKVAKNRVLADLVLDHCSLSAEQGFVDFGPWLGARPGPDRPLVVSSLGCTFLGNFEKGSKDSTILRSDPLGIASGAIFWQSSGDLFDVPNFTSALGGRPAGPPIVTKRLDIRWDWVELWGQNHAKNNSGPRGGVTPSTPLFAKLKPGDVEPGDLYLNSNGKNAPEVGANLAKLGIMPSPVVGRKR